MPIGFAVNKNLTSNVDQVGWSAARSAAIGDRTFTGLIASTEPDGFTAAGIEAGTAAADTAGKGNSGSLRAPSFSCRAGGALVAINQLLNI
jgi:hypothetical protein